MKYHIELRHKDTIKVGDVIECRDGVLRTVCRKDITGIDSGDRFMGTRLFGDSYKLGLDPVRLAVIEKAELSIQQKLKVTQLKLMREEPSKALPVKSVTQLGTMCIG